MFVLATNMSSNRNWNEYNSRLIRRGEITLYVEPAVLMQNKELERMNKGKIGRRFQYGNGLIFASFALKCFLRLAYRQTEGLVRELTKKLNLNKVPNFRTVWDRIVSMKKEEIRFNISPLKPGEKIEIAIDSTGLKRINDGEYRSTRYGKIKSWIKMHLSVNVNTGEAMTEVTTKDNVHDNLEFMKLVKPMEDNLSQVDADGAYDSIKTFEWGERNNVFCAIPVRINSSNKCSSPIRKRIVREQLGFRKGRGHYKLFRNPLDKRLLMQKVWKEKSGYGRRWIVEGAYGKFKGMFGEYVFSKRWQMIQKEIRAKLYVYNQTLTMF